MIVGIDDAAVNVSTSRPNWLAITDSRARPSTRLAILPTAISTAAIAIRRASVAAGVAGDTGAVVFMRLARRLFATCRGDCRIDHLIDQPAQRLLILKH